MRSLASIVDAQALPPLMMSPDAMIFTDAIAFHAFRCHCHFSPLRYFCSCHFRHYQSYAIIATAFGAFPSDFIFAIFASFATFSPDGYFSFHYAISPRCATIRLRSCAMSCF
jgi:hypothetical protein